MMSVQVAVAHFEVLALAGTVVVVLVVGMPVPFVVLAAVVARYCIAAVVPAAVVSLAAENGHTLALHPESLALACIVGRLASLK